MSGDYIIDPANPWNETSDDELAGVGAGNDTIDVGDFGTANNVFGGNGDDIIFGGIAAPGTAANAALKDRLFGGGGDDVIYAQNPGQLEVDKAASPDNWDYLVGGDDDD